MKRIAIILAFCISLGNPAFAQGGMGPGPGTVHSTGGGAYTGPGDLTGWTTPYAFYSLFAMTAAIATAGTQAGARTSRASDSHQCDLLATATGPGNTTNCGTGGDNAQSYTSFCASTTCSWVTWIDQSGNGRDQVASNSPLFNLTGLSGKPSACFNGATTLSLFVNASFGTVSAPVTIASVAMRTGIDAPNLSGIMGASYGGTGVILGFDGATSNTAYVYAGGGAVMDATASDNAPHVFIGAMDGTSSVLNVDGTETADGTNIGGSGFNGVGQIGGSGGIANYLVGCISEVIYVASKPSSGERAALIANQRARFGF